MSDFDKEAEREKLREKYERDKADREATQHMSDLLLKGATMTNTHCGVCGDPLFRQDGTTFCPSCHGGPGAVEGQGGVPQQEGENAGARAGTPAETGAAADAGIDATENTAGIDATENTADVDAGTDAAAHADTDTPASGRTQSPTDSPATDQSATERANADSSGTQIDVSSPSSDSQPSESARDPTAGTAPDESTPSRSSANAEANTDANAGRPASNATTTRSSGGLADTRAALRGTLEYFSQEAAATDDPRYAKECLEAAREAAETLSALR